VTATPPLQKEWKRLFEAALRIKGMAPWEWMIETDVFGVEDPERGDIGFVSVMGNLGEHLGISVYLGTRALAGMLELHRLPPRTLSEYPELLIEIPQLQVSFEDRNDLDDWDRQLIRSLGVKVRGSQAWPLFQSFRPGYMPWRLEPDEIRVLATALEQLEAVAPRVRDDASLLKYNKAGRCLIRTRIEDETWEDRVVAIPPPERPPISLRWNADDAERLKRVACRGDILEFDFFLFPGVIGKKTERPETAYVLFALLHHSNTMLCAEILQVRNTLENMRGQIPEILLAQLANLGMRPAEIRVQSPLLLEILPPVFEKLGIRVVRHASMKKLRAAKREMERVL
jgi:hypothetical protein